MRAHYLQHAPFEGLGKIEQWLERNGYEVSATHLYRDEPLPETKALQQIDLLIIMGGPMSVNDEVQLPWLAAEKAFIRQALTEDRRILGICLGAQLIASALGNSVHANAQQEIGWFPVQGNTHHNGAAFHFPPEVTVLHWHGETFDLPHGAVPLASSVACANQAFQLGRSVIGLQFHLEATRALLTDFIQADGQSLQQAEFVQPAEQILSVNESVLAATTELLDQLLNYLTRKEGAV
jgi:GMP synthase-like glutamine amidotransferase